MGFLSVSLSEFRGEVCLTWYGIKYSPNVTTVVQRSEESWLHVCPAALVLVLLLCPDQLGVLVEIRLFLDQIEGERRNLQDTS